MKGGLLQRPDHSNGAGENEEPNQVIAIIDDEWKKRKEDTSASLPIGEKKNEQKK